LKTILLINYLAEEAIKLQRQN